MVSWFARRRPEADSRRAEGASVRPRGASAPSTRIDFTELTPDLVPFLGQAAYIQLEMFENLSRAVALAPDLGAKERLSASAGVALRKHHALIEQLRRLGAEPAEVMAPFAPALDAFRRATAGSDWWEMLLSGYITAGMLDDYFTALASGLSPDARSRVVHILAEDGGAAALVRELATGIAETPGLADRLALWGRRLVGDTLLVARSALRSGSSAAADARIEPVFTELIAAHTRRMDGLGLTA
ncbi:ferritin-like domain-containing protein [Agromyces atrinae]|uniref:ferritin-like fold-containing protein n=1 Tax=Agromyces atrinae TaxID=592376 RepID=UPI001F597AB1|nr:ferritin-like fold-containing protein [Agromyces atrinae]MCI2959192.1 ferritin-like domain-containing protein [Agromyces atrinae]